MIVAAAFKICVYSCAIFFKIVASVSVSTELDLIFSRSLKRRLAGICPALSIAVLGVAWGFSSQKPIRPFSHVGLNATHLKLSGYKTLQAHCLPMQVPIRPCKSRFDPSSSVTIQFHKNFCLKVRPLMFQMW